MPYYCFILGNNPILSLAEIFNREASTGETFSVIDLTSKALVVEPKAAFNPRRWQQDLGGTIKIIEIVTTFKSWTDLYTVLTPDYAVQKLFPLQSNKFVFGFSLYGDIIWRNQTECKKLGLSLKKGLRGHHYKSRYVEGVEGILSSVQVAKNNMITKGADIAVVSGLYGFYLGKAVTVQNFEDYSKRDYGRPQRDAQSGMVPPKLAKIMVNLSLARPDDPILDPFCGSGTVLQEAALMNYTNIIGADISARAVADTKKNIGWLTKTHQLEKHHISVYQSDIADLPEKIKPGTMQAIITEPYLGPPLSQEPTADTISKTINELDELYLKAFSAFATLLVPKGRIVVIFPLFRLASGVYTLKILEKLHAMGFTRINPLPEKITLFAKIGPTARGSLMYQRPDQLVQREIFIFQKNK